MKILVDKLPEESYKCIFGQMEMDHYYENHRWYSEHVVRCRVDGYLCDLDCCGICDKLKVMGGLNYGCN